MLSWLNVDFVLGNLIHNLLPKIHTGFDWRKLLYSKSKFACALQWIRSHAEWLECAWFVFWVDVMTVLAAPVNMWRSSLEKCFHSVYWDLIYGLNPCLFDLLWIWLDEISVLHYLAFLVADLDTSGLSLDLLSSEIKEIILDLRTGKLVQCHYIFLAQRKTINK